jgi:hypothetical protein
VKAVIETKEPVKEPVKRRRSGCSEEKKLKRGDLCRGSDYYSVSKLSGTKLTGRLLICLSLINRKEKRRA